MSNTYNHKTGYEGRKRILAIGESRMVAAPIVRELDQVRAVLIKASYLWRF